MHVIYPMMIIKIVHHSLLCSMFMVCVNMLCEKYNIVILIFNNTWGMNIAVDGSPLIKTCNLVGFDKWPLPSLTQIFSVTNHQNLVMISAKCQGWFFLECAIRIIPVGYKLVNLVSMSPFLNEQCNKKKAQLLRWTVPT